MSAQLVDHLRVAADHVASAGYAASGGRNQQAVAQAIRAAALAATTRTHPDPDDLVILGDWPMPPSGDAPEGAA